CGKYMGANAYGHTGYTGTSLWIDPERDMFVVLLTNRVHAARARRPAKVIADVRADLADAAALAVTDFAGGPIAMPRSFRADLAVGWNKPERAARGRSKGKKSKTSAASRSKSKASASKAKPKTSSSKSSASRPKAKSSAAAAKKSTVKVATVKKR
ncbi:MAG: serine hydrolase, partial [bacterium]